MKLFWVCKYKIFSYFLGEVHFYSIVSDRNAQYLQVLSTWACATIHFAKVNMYYLIKYTFSKNGSF